MTSHSTPSQASHSPRGARLARSELAEGWTQGEFWPRTGPEEARQELLIDWSGVSCRRLRASPCHEYGGQGTRPFR